jgi:hypothetical protein
MTCVIAKQENNHFDFPRILLNSGGTRSSIAATKIPKKSNVIQKKNAYSAFLADGVTQHDKFVIFDNLFLPEFSRHHWIEDVEIVVMDDQGNSAFDIILGRDYLQKLGMDVKFSLREVEWNDRTIPFRPHSTNIQTKFLEYTSPIISLADDALMSIDIKPSDYTTQSTPEQIAKKQLHLPPVHRLTDQSKHKTKINWSSEYHRSFEKLKSQLAQQAMLSFPNPKFPFIIEPDASDYQLG